MKNAMLTQKTVVVTGAAAGIGEAAAELFAAEGGRVVMLDRDGDAVAKVAERIAARGGEATAFGADITDEAQLARVFEQIEEQVGTIDAAFNNAGIPGPAGGLLGVEPADWSRTLEINLTGTWRCLRHEVKLMSTGASIVNTTSLAGLIGARYAGAYAASKHAIIGLTKSAALEYGVSGIRVNAIAPGPTRTAMLESVIASGARNEADFTAPTALKRMAEPREIAEAALWLLSDRSSFVTGHTLVVDGGQMAS